MTGDSGDPRRMVAAGVGVLVGYVLVVGNPWLNRDLQISLTDSDPAFRLIRVLVFYPSWLLDPDEFGLYQFWMANLRTILFVGLGVVGLTRVTRWVRESAGGAGVFVATVGVIALSAVAAGLAAEAIVNIWLASPFPGAEDMRTDYFLGQLSVSASFGVLFGLVIGAVAVAQRHRPQVVVHRAGRRQSNAPKSFW